MLLLFKICRYYALETSHFSVISLFLLLINFVIKLLIKKNKMKQLHKNGIPENNIIYFVNCDEIRLQRFLNKTKIKSLENVIFFEKVNRMNINIIVYSKIWLGLDYGKYNKVISYRTSLENQNRPKPMDFYCLGSNNFLKQFMLQKKIDENTVIYRNSEFQNFYLSKSKKENNFVLMNFENNEYLYKLNDQIQMFETPEQNKKRNKVINTYFTNKNYIVEMLKNVKI